MPSKLPERVEEVRRRLRPLIDQEIAPRAEQVDRDAAWPEQGMRLLQQNGLMGLNVPRELGGAGQGMLGLVGVCEALGEACSSTAICFGMHCVATAVIAAKATADQKERYLRPIAEGRHITTLSLSEPGTGSHFYLPQTRLERDGGMYRVNGTKTFVTNGGKADSYVLNTLASVPDAEPGDFSCLIVDGDAGGIEWQERWKGLGMRGNEARGLRMNDVRVPVANLLGEEGDQIWYMFEVVTPFFLVAMAGVYLGIASAALDTATKHLLGRELTHSGETLAEIPVLQHRLAEAWIDVQRTRLLTYRAAELGDYGDPEALPVILASKAAVADTAVKVANEALGLSGGAAYRENAKLARLLRDARAAHVMAPTTDILKCWIGRLLLKQPLL